MKFGSFWKQHVELLPDDLRIVCLSYKKWKKLAKGDHEIDVRNLEKECEVTSNTLCELVKLVNTQKSTLSMCISHERKIDPHELFMFADLNKTCLYKICKRIDKRLNTTTYKEWYKKHYSSYKFNYGLYYTRLMLHDEKTKIEECPICLEDMDNSKPSVLTHARLGAKAPSLWP
jgi:hypothetical protein